LKQLVHFPKDGAMSVQDVPAISARRGTVLVKTAVSLVSAGTERMAMEFAEKSLFAKARSRPDLVKQVLDKARREGILNTVDAVRSRLSQPASLGYSAAGVVLEVGSGVSRFRPGDRVACAGADHAVHAELICVPQNLVAKIPDQTEAGEVPFDEAAFTTLGAIAMHGFRLAQVHLGETVAVIGLGLLGLITVQLAKAAGCRVLGMELNPARADLALNLGCDVTAGSASEMESLVAQYTAGVGADAVIITAATLSNEPVELAARIARGRATVVSVGAVGTEIPRKPYFEKELNFVISRSYGPGRYDPNYEDKGTDYPVEFVRWTENRNMEAFLDLFSRRQINVSPLITHRFPIEDATDAYDLISGKRSEPFLGVLLTYSDNVSFARQVKLSSAPPVGTVRIGMLGAGNFATAVLIPAMQQVKDVELIGVATGSGVSARHVGERFGFRYCATDERELLEDSSINTIAIATRHNAHARQVIAALSAAKNVFCEKPLCIREEELAEIIGVHDSIPTPRLMIGFNRRFAPLARRMKDFFSDTREPLSINYRVNAGYIPQTHWTQDPGQGGGRVIGEACHFIDLLTFLTGSTPVRVYAAPLSNDGRYNEDNLHITLQFENGSIGTVSYLANGDKSVPKERVEIFAAGSVAILDDFRTLELTRDGKRERITSKLRQDKGHQGEWQAFVDAIRTGTQSPIAFREIVATTLTTFRVLDSARTGAAVDVSTDDFISASVNGA
jgi:predicted dehydrogenase/threonine dehydrogenase-like Zn-dependent dehydrogenase